MKTSRTYNYLICLLFTIALLTGCTTQNNEIPIIDMDSVSSQTEVKISDLLDDIHLLKLELADEEPIPAYVIPWVGEKHILINTRQKILQYSSDGKFVRVLISSGNGPGEFMRIIAYDVDEKNDILYFYDAVGTNKISSIDLKSGNALKDIPLPTEDRLTYAGLLLIDNNTLLCFTNEYSEAEYLYYYLSLSGEVQYGKPKISYKETNPLAGSNLYLRKNENAIRYMPKNDTVFIIDNNEFIPEYILSENDIFNMSEGKLQGNMPKLHLETTRFTIINNPELEAQIMENGGFRINTIESTQYILDNQDYSISMIKEFSIDYLGHNETSLRFVVSGKNAFLTYDVAKLMEIADNVIADKNAERQLADRMTKLRQTLSENDNPYFLIGKLK